MARDSSPFARRIKALTNRGGSPETGDHASADAAASGAAPAEPEVDPTPPDEQPTGEFPAIPEPHGGAAGPVPDAPVEPRAYEPEPAPTWHHDSAPATPESEPEAQPADTPFGAPQPSTPEPVAAPTDEQPAAPESSEASADDQPTTQIPAVSPVWLDPPPYEQVPQGSGSGAVEWSSPAEDVIEPLRDAYVPTEPAGADALYTSASPTDASEATPVEDGPAAVAPLADEPLDEAPLEAASNDEAPVDDALASSETEPNAAGWEQPAPATPAWEQDPVDGPEGSSPSAIVDTTDPSADADAALGALADGPTHAPPVLGNRAASEPTQPAWLDEAEPSAEAIDPGAAGQGAVVPPILTAPDVPANDLTPSSGPTLLPPVLPIREEPEPVEAIDAISETPDAPSAGAPYTAADGNPLPDESEPEWTPTALHEALSLDEDEPELPEEPFAVSTPSVDASTADDATQVTQVSDAVAEPTSGRRGWRSAFGKRKTDESSPEPTPPIGADAPAAEPADLPTADVTAPATSVWVPAPEATAAESPTHGDAGSVDVDTAAAAVAAAGAIAASDAPGDDDPASDDSTAAPSDPGGITGRFSAIGRRAMALGGRKTAGPSSEYAGEPEPSDGPTLPDPTPEPEVAPDAGYEPQPELVPFKPSFAERAALRRRAKTLRARRDAGLAELGAIVLDQSRFGDPTAGTLVRRRTTELADLDGEIAAIETALETEQAADAVTQLGVVHCSSCSALVGPADRFCAHCGTARPAPGDAEGATSDAS